MSTVFKVLVRERFRGPENFAVKAGIAPLTVRKLENGGIVTDRVRDAVEKTLGLPMRDLMREVSLEDAIMLTLREQRAQHGKDST